MTDISSDEALLPPIESSRSSFSDDTYSHQIMHPKSLTISNSAVWVLMSLWKSSSEHLSLSIPETVILNKGFPISWVFVSKDNLIKRHFVRSNKLDAVHQHFILSAQKLNASMGVNTPLCRFFLSASSSSTSILTRPEFRKLILTPDASSPVYSGISIIQLYIDDFSYSPYSISIKFSKSNSSIELNTTYHSNLKSNQRALDVASGFVDKASQDTRKLVEWLEKMHNVVISDITCYFSISHLNLLYFLYSDNIRLENEVPLNFSDEILSQIFSSVDVNVFENDAVQSPSKKFNKILNCRLGLCGYDPIDFISRSEFYKMIDESVISDDDVFELERHLIESSRMFYRKSDPYLINARISKIPVSIYRDKYIVCKHCYHLGKIFKQNFQESISLCQIEKITSEPVKPKIRKYKVTKPTTFFDNTSSAEIRRATTLSRLEEVRSKTEPPIQALDRLVSRSKSPETSIDLMSFLSSNQHCSFPVLGSEPIVSHFPTVTLSDNSTCSYLVISHEKPRYVLVYFASMLMDLYSCVGFFKNFSIVSPVSIVLLGLPGHYGTSFNSNLDCNYHATCAHEGLTMLISQGILSIDLFNKKTLPFLLTSNAETFVISLTFALNLVRSNQAINFSGLIAINPVISQSINDKFSLFLKRQVSHATSDRNPFITSVDEFFSDTYLQSVPISVLSEVLSTAPWSLSCFNAQIQGILGSVEHVSPLLARLKETRLLRLIPTLVVRSEQSSFLPLSSTLSKIVNIIGGPKYVCNDPALLFSSNPISRLCDVCIGGSVYPVVENPRDLSATMSAFAFNLVRFIEKRNKNVE
ncbi:hypothetical protein RCL1_003854 [Eukaryota sp. TZLM3-RCL]